MKDRSGEKTNIQLNEKNVYEIKTVCFKKIIIIFKPRPGEG